MITRKKRKSGPPRRRPALDGQVHRQAPSQRAALPGLIVVVSIFFIFVTPFTSSSGRWIKPLQRHGDASVPRIIDCP